ncbi:QueT transporter family protein [Lancefieldella parvula]|uniref:QueT transporter family protein n=1 Tax=Lancefieldella parvula TaxID=1382 RepID=UPI0029091144|nr:QueT transporter family protein [Lancefieldella parvula]MDU4868194.1 QueT transporter family protein [Lancefieldella parvula]
MPQVSSAYATKQRAQRLARIGIIAALYAALTLATLLFLGGLAWGPVQFRISEAVVVIALFTADAIPGLTLGCVIANLANMVISGTGALGLLDVFFGSLATALGAWFTWKNRKNVPIALLGPVLANAVIVSAYLPILLQGLGFYTIPFTTIELDGSYPFMFLFGFITTGLGEAVVLYVLGAPLARALKHSSLPQQLAFSEGSTTESVGN